MANQITFLKNTAAPTASTADVIGQPLWEYNTGGTLGNLYMGYDTDDNKHVRVGAIVSTNTSLTSSNDNLSTSLAIKTYVDAQAGTDIVTYGNLSGNSDIGFNSDQVPQGSLTAPLASPALTGNPTAPTQSAGNASTRVATTAYADTAISNLVDSSPAALNTLNELAAALGDDASFSTTVTNSIATKAPIADPTFTGEIGIGSVNVSETELGLLEGLTSSTAELNTLDGFDGDVDDLKYAKDLYDTDVTATEFNYLDGVTSAIQTQIDSKQASGSYQANDAQLTILAAMTSGVANAYKDLQEAEIQILDGATLSTTELNYVDGVTSAIQTQLDAKSTLALGTSSSTALAGDTTVTNWSGGSTGLTAATGLTSLGGTTTGKEIFTLADGSGVRFIRIDDDDGITTRSAANVMSDLSLDTELQNLSSAEIDYLEALYATGVTSTEYDYLDGVSSAIQTQIDTKQATLTFGKSSGNALKSEEALTTNDIMLMGSAQVKGRTYTELKSDLSLNNVENTAISGAAIAGGTYSV